MQNQFELWFFLIGHICYNKIIILNEHDTSCCAVSFLESEVLQLSYTCIFCSVVLTNWGKYDFIFCWIIIFGM